MSVCTQNFLFTLAVQRMWEVDSVFWDKLMELLHLVVCEWRVFHFFPVFGMQLGLFHTINFTVYVSQILLTKSCLCLAPCVFLVDMSAILSQGMSHLTILCFSSHSLWTSSVNVYLGLPVDSFPCSHACHDQGIYNFASCIYVLEPSEVWINI
jgi:hypothetical protein